jgi:hypothetical protein
MKRTITIFLFALGGIVTNAQLITATGSLNVPRWNHTSQQLGNGKVLVTGGDNGNFTSPLAYNSAELYSGGTWTYTGSMMEIRDYATSVLLNSGDVLVIGGATTNLIPRHSCEKYNVSAGTWSYTDSLTNARYGAQAVTLQNGNILAIGGMTVTCELYNQNTSTWSVTGSMNVNRGTGFSATELANGNVLVTGSGTGDSTAEVYDATSGVWTLLTSYMDTARAGATSILLNTNNILVVGGDNYNTEVFNTTTSTFSTTKGHLTQYFAYDPMVTLSNNNILIYGIGDFLSSTNKDALQVFDPSTGNWWSAGTVSVSIFTADNYTVQTLSTGKILYIGGNFSTGNGSSQYCYIVDPTQIAKEPTAIDEISNNGISIAAYPNPTSDKFVLNANFNENEKINIKLTDMLGKNIMEIQDVPATKTYSREIDLSGNNIPAGFYFLTVQTNSGSSTLKIVKD